MKKKLLLIFIALDSMLVMGQNLYFTNYTTSQGLIQNSVYSITQSKEGFMWFGTQAGLDRFDGKNFEQLYFKYDEKDTLNNISNMYTALLIDRQDYFWLGTSQGLALYNRYVNFLVNPKKIFSNLDIPMKVWVEKIVEDDNNTMWIQTRSKLYAFNKKENRMIALPSTIANNFVKGMVYKNQDASMILASDKELMKYQNGKFERVECNSIFTTSDTKIRNIEYLNTSIWIITTDNKVWIINEDGSIQNFTKLYPSCDLLLDPTSLHKSSDTHMWIGSRSEGIMIIDTKNQTCERSSMIYHPNALTKNFILSMYTTDQHTTWIGISGGGVSKYAKNTAEIKLYRNEGGKGKPTPDNMILSMYTDNDEDFYQGTLTGGLLHTNVLKNTYTYHKLPKEVAKNTDANNVYTIVKGNGDDLWMATWGGLCVYNKVTGKMQLYNDSDGKTIQLAALLRIPNTDTLIVGGYNMGLRYFDIKTKKWSVLKNSESIDADYLNPRYLSLKNNDELIISSEVKNLVKYNRKTGVYQTSPQLNKITGTARYHLVEGDYIWVGTERGLHYVDYKNLNIIKSYTIKSGLQDDFIYGILRDEPDKLVVSTNRGIARINTDNNKIEKYNDDDGLQSMEFNTAVCYKDAKNNLWFGGINGINKLNFSNTLKNENLPTPIITKILAVNEPIKSDTVAAYLSNIKLEYKQNFLSFEFQCPTNVNTDNIVYAYKLTGLDMGWIYSGARNFVTYSHLSPGNYTFLVKSSSDNFMWSDASNPLRITIGRPWYTSWWFLCLLLIGIGVFIWYLYQTRVVNRRHESEIKNKLHETEMAALKAQMNPHFIFNCINSIDAYIQCNDKYNASMYLNKFAKLIRNILESSKKNLVAFDKDIETMKIYIELEEMRSENKFTSQFIVDEELYDLDIEIPPLIIQPFVENAIIHGLRNKETNDGLLIIKVSMQENTLVYQIQDNGIGRKAASLLPRKKDLSYGMQLSEDRIKLYNEESESNIKIKDLYDVKGPTGTLIEVRLNLSLN